MHAVDLLASAFPRADWPEMPAEPAPGVCCVTGAECLTIPRKLTLGSNFADHDGLAAPSSDRCGVHAFVALRYAISRGADKKRPRWPEMNNSWWTDGREFRELDRLQARALVLDGSPSTPWAGWITTTQKKHGAFRAQVNTSERGVWAMDDYLADCRGDRARRWYDRMTAAQDAGIGRQSIETVDMPAGLIRKIGPAVWLDFQQWALPRRNNGLYWLLVWLLPTQAEKAGAPAVTKPLPEDVP